LHEVFGERTAKQPLFVGSVKSNIGHLEGASGVVSVIKTAMMLENGIILPNCNFEKGNPKIPFEEWGIKVSGPPSRYKMSPHISLGSHFHTPMASRQEVCQYQQFWLR